MVVGAILGASAASGGMSLLQVVVSSAGVSAIVFTFLNWWDSHTTAHRPSPPEEDPEAVKATIAAYASSEHNQLPESTNSDCHGPVKRPRLTGALLHLLERGLSGVCVLLAPPGTGKSTSLRTAIDLYRSAHPSAKVYGVRGLQTDFFSASLHIPAWASEIDFLPKQSVIVFDQMHATQPLTDNECDFIVRMATSSRNSGGHVRVFLVLSSASVAEQVLHLHGREKIYLGATPEMFKWDFNELRELAGKYNETESEGEQRVRLPEHVLDELVSRYARAGAVSHCSRGWKLCEPISPSPCLWKAK